MHSRARAAIEAFAAAEDEVASIHEELASGPGGDEEFRACAESAREAAGKAREFLRTFTARPLCSGSVMVLQKSHEIVRYIHEKQTLRSREEVAAFFTGLDMVEPGLVRIPEWRPDNEADAKSPSALWGGVARKR